MLQKSDDLLRRAISRVPAAAFFSAVACSVVWSAIMFLDAYGHAAREGIEMPPLLVAAGPHLESTARPAAAPLILVFTILGGDPTLTLRASLIGMGAAVGSTLGLAGAWAARGWFRRAVWIVATLLALLSGILFTAALEACRHECDPYLPLMLISVSCSVALSVPLALAIVAQGHAYSPSPRCRQP